MDECHFFTLHLSYSMINMRNATLILFIFLCPSCLYASNQVDSLLRVLDKTISQRLEFTQKKELRIRDLQQKKINIKKLDQLYQINRDIIDQYQSFVCDSAERYIQENCRLAERLGNAEYIQETKLQLSFIYSLSGLFIPATDILQSIRYDELPTHFKLWYCWNYIRYYENLIKYTDDVEFSKEYIRAKDATRDTLMSLLNKDSDEYLKEKAFRLQENGHYAEAADILVPFHQKQQPGTHAYAMASMSLAKVYSLADDEEKEMYFLVRAAITDVQLAVKENESLLSLAIKLYEKGDVNRSYNYIKVALDDAIFYNARFRNAVIARVQPIIEDTYLYKIEQQQQNLRLYSLLTSLLVIAMGIILYFYYRQVKKVSKARKELRRMNDKLTSLNKKLDEANLIKEKYIGYFMNQCAVYINKLDEYRKNVNRKIKTGQIDDLYKSSSRALEKEVEELYANFDHAFLKLYPDFVTEFNLLLKPEEHYKTGANELNTELRIFALIRLGITDVSQIAIFLRYSMQTIYNYKSKVKGKSLTGSDLFEEEVKKLGTIS